MTHFVTRTVPSHRTDHSLRHSTTRVGLRARRVRILFFSRKCPFRVIFVSYSTRFSAPGPIFWKPPGLSHVSIDFWTIGPRSRPFTGRFVAFPSRKLLAQTKTRMTQFCTRMVPSHRTDHSLRHSTTRVGLRARQVRILFFRENVPFGRFSWAIAHSFRHSGQFLGNLPDCHKILVDDIYEVSIDFWTIGPTFQAFYGSFRYLS
jgi:hypothetical protein